MALTLVTAPPAEPITLAEAKALPKVEDDAEDTLLAAIIVAARRWVEETCGRALVTQTWDFSMDGFPRGSFIKLPRPPLVSVTSITYYDEDLSTSTVFASSKYQVDAAKTPGLIALKYGESWPTDSLRLSSGVVVRFVAGYGAAAAVPGDIKHAVKLLVSDMYAHRESEVTGTIVAKMGFAVDALLAPYRVW